jgi:long-chain fatty acid transport protein
MRTHRLLRFLPLFLIVSIFPAIAWTSNPTQGARAAGMGGALTAVAGDPSAIAFNPAGLTQLKLTNIYGGLSALTLRSTFEDPQGGSEETRSQIFFAPHLYFCSDFGIKNTQFGFGIFSPFGIGGRKWPESGITRYVSTESLIATVVVNPTIAFQPWPGFSIGGGANYLFAQGTSKRKLDQSALGASDGSLEFEADGGGWGFNLGVLYFLSDNFSLGAAYRSRVKVEQKGKVTVQNIAPALQPLFGGGMYKTDAATTLRFPDLISAGLAFRPTKRWTIGIDVERLDWSQFSRIHIDLANEVPEAGLTDIYSDAGWKTSWRYKIGLEHLVTERFCLRGGYVYATSPVPAHTLSPDNPDSDNHNLSLGFGYKFKKIHVDTFYNITLFEDRQVVNPVLSGRYGNRIHTAGFSLWYNF